MLAYVLETLQYCNRIMQRDLATNYPTNSKKRKSCEGGTVQTQPQEKKTKPESIFYSVPSAVFKDSLFPYLQLSELIGLARASQFLFRTVGLRLPAFSNPPIAPERPFDEQPDTWRHRPITFPRNGLLSNKALENLAKAAASTQKFTWNNPEIDTDDLKKSLRHLTNLTNINLDNCSNLGDSSFLGVLGEKSKLTKLSFQDCESMVDLTYLEDLRNLLQLNISGCEALRELSALHDLCNLQYLDMSGVHLVTNFAVLRRLVSLTFLNISHCYGCTDISFLEEMKVQTLVMRNLDGLEGPLDPVGNMPNLTELDVTGSAATGDMRWLAGTNEKLESLNISENDELWDLSAVAQLPSLTVLIATSCPSVVDVLSFFPSMKNRLRKADFRFCENMSAESKDYLEQIKPKIPTCIVRPP